MDEAKLKDRLWGLQLDHIDSALPFSRRLARENGWSHAFALRAIEEYRRFVFLAAVAGHAVTPSDEVDQVWHLHLCYTRSYWDEMCGEVLGKPLHHGPTRGGHQEGAKFDTWYRRTLGSYQRIFGEQPPQDLWPTPGQRFAQRNWRRIDVDGTWLVSRRRMKRQLLAGAVVVGLMGAAGCSSMLGDDIGAVVAILAVLGLIGLIVRLLVDARAADGRDSSASSGPGGCSGGAGCGSTSKRDDDDSDGGEGGTGGDGGDGGCGASGCGGGCGGGCGS